MNENIKSIKSVFNCTNIHYNCRLLIAAVSVLSVTMPQLLNLLFNIIRSFYAQNIIIIHDANIPLKSKTVENLSVLLSSKNITWLSKIVHFFYQIII